MTCRVLILVYRKPGMTPEDFKRHYETVHIPLVREIAGPTFPLSHVRRYIRRTKQPDGTYSAALLSGVQGDFGFDAVSELTYEDEVAFRESFAAMNAPEAAKRISEDCAMFMDQSKAPVVLLEDCVETCR
ncbi:uncharacterized protein Z518_01790 [Rhinocladiella mackenziei CBS 650.93]|uniref:EthD domain-containing protein n=1 Tax=Rhinocladiella mackenziei CBS 650.93 TaxID=1442369 RepID=A0A0D2J4Q7_9EURO|nr:uncharacterized protein Z518_01790 [Rhinocladiella mackenziei CBS 650.93]KIX10706.1 hypothetical protein Z518_01790 [Rhinocladiella mackenziei CBS 650.93]